MAKILVLHGPNLNLLGSREPEHYGNMTLTTINDQLTQTAKQAGHKLETLQSNAEDVLIERIQQIPQTGINILIINPAAFTHTSVAIRDAILSVQVPFIEVHLTNIYNRESFRQNSYFSDIAIGVISGFGAQSYDLAMQASIKYLTKKAAKKANN